MNLVKISVFRREIVMYDLGVLSIGWASEFSLLILVTQFLILCCSSGLVFFSEEQQYYFHERFNACLKRDSLHIGLPSFPLAC